MTSKSKKRLQYQLKELRKGFMGIGTTKNSVHDTKKNLTTFIDSLSGLEFDQKCR